MKELYFTSPYRKSTRTVRLEFGKVKEIFVLKTYSGEINASGDSEGSPREEFFGNEQEMLKKVYEIKKGMMQGRWIVQNKESISQHSFLKTDIIDGEVSVEFDNQEKNLGND